MEETLGRLCAWYTEQCDGEWEHSFGVRIETLDNPGWSVTVDLEGTALQKENLKEVNTSRSEEDWVSIRIDSERFSGDGGVRNLEEILQTFLNWAE